MDHIDPDELAALALDEPADPASDEHLAACPRCAAELRSLVDAVRIGRDAVTVDRLERPRPEVWESIRSELGIRDAEPADAAPVVPLRGRRSGDRRPLLLVAAAVVAVLGGVSTWAALSPSSVEVLARADLGAFPDWPGASGSAVLVETADGGREIRVDIDAPLPTSGYRELWLLNSDATELVSLGTIDSESGTFVVPEDVDLSVFEVVDISAEPADGDPAHSGDSIVRGVLGT